jgi:hypothetical protein
LNIEIGGIAYLIKTSEEWALETLALLRSEIAWEVNTEGSTVTSCYMLMGDGFPVNGGERGNYTRLRVNLNDFPIKPAGKSLNSLISYINQILSDVAAVQNLMDSHLADTRAHGATSTPAPDRIAMYDSEGALKSGKAPVQDDDLIRKLELDAEAEAREKADEGLAGDVDELHKLILDTTSDMMRFVDDDNDSISFAYQRRIDKEWGAEEFLEVDNAGCCWNADFVTEEQYNVLYDFVMSVSGADVLQVDVYADMEMKPNRIIDKEGKVEELRQLDGNQFFGNTEWVDP